MKGVLIVIAGTDGSGKATQVKILKERLIKNGFKVEVTDFPQYGQKSAALVEEYLNGKYGSPEDVGPYRASIFYACDRYAASFKMREWLNEGKIIVSNRYVSANIGHQGGKIEDVNERNKYLDWLFHLEFNIFQIPRPDKNILLYVPPEISQELVDQKDLREYIENGKKRDIHEENLDHLKNAADAYLYAAEKYNWDKIECAPDGKLKTKEEISEEVWKKVINVIKTDS
jgi:dTMP kinase